MAQQSTANFSAHVDQANREVVASIARKLGDAREQGRNERILLGRILLEAQSGADYGETHEARATWYRIADYALTILAIGTIEHMDIATLEAMANELPDGSNKDEVLARIAWLQTPPAHGTELHSFYGGGTLRAD